MIYDNDSTDIRQHYQMARCTRHPVMLSTRFYTGPEANSSSSSTTARNEQTTLGDTGAGSVNVNTGADGTSELTLNTEDIDPAVLDALGSIVGDITNVSSYNNAVVATNAISAENNTANNAIAGTVDTAANALGFGSEALASNTATTANALGFGAEALNDNTAVAGAAIDASAAAGEEIASVAAGAEGVSTDALAVAAANDSSAFSLANDALASNTSVVNANASLAQDAISAVTSEASYSQQSSNDAVYQSQLNQAQLESDLAQIVANAAPQTSAAETEITSGSTPIDSSNVSSSTNWTNIALIAGLGLSLYAFINSHGRNT